MVNTRGAAPAVAAIGRTALDLVLPASCAGCGVRGAPCCTSCALALRTGGVFAHRTGALVLAPYDGVPRRLVLAYKERGRRDLARPLGRALADALPGVPAARPDDDGRWWLVPVPSRRPAARARGGPHMLALARQCAARLAEVGVPVAVAPALGLGRGARDAVGLSRAERVANLAGRLRPHREGAPPPGTPVVLLDDVVTTGATVAACTRTLHGIGIQVAAALALTGA